MKNRIATSVVAAALLASTSLLSTGAYADPVTLRMTALAGSSGQGTQALVAEWNKNHPDIQVNVEIQADETNWQRTAPSTMFNASDGPDLSWWWCTPSNQFQDMIGANLLAPLDDVFDKAAYPEGMVHYFTEPDGHVYGINNAVVWTPWVYYNKDVFAKLGLEPPKTWDDLYNIAAKVRANGMQPLATLYDFGAVSHLMIGVEVGELSKDEYNALTVNWSKNAPAEAQKVKWTDPNGVNIFKRLKEIVDKGVLADGFAGLTDGDVAKSLFTSGKAAMFQSGSWDVNTTTDAAKFNVGVFTYPTSNANHYGALASWLPNCFIAFNRDHVAEAKQVLKFFTSRDGQFIFSKAGGDTPGRIDIPQSQLGEIVRPLTLEMLAKVKDAGAPALMDASTPPSIGTDARTITGMLLTGQYTPEQAAQAMQDSYDKVKNGN